MVIYANRLRDSQTRTVHRQMRQSSRQANGEHKAAYDTILGVNADSPQFGLLGQVHGRRVALDLNQTHTIKS